MVKVGEAIFQHESWNSQTQLRSVPWGMWLNHVSCTDSNFEIVQDQSIIELFSYYAQRDCTLPCVELLEEAALKKCSEVKARTQKLLAPVRKVSITLDLCITKIETPFVGIRAHWVDDAWTLCERFLGVVDMLCLDDEEADINLASLLIRTLKDFNLTDKVIAITSNHAKNIEEMVVSFPEVLKGADAGFSKQYLIPCLAHVVNRIDQEGLGRLGILRPHSTIGFDDEFEDSDRPTRPCEVPMQTADNTLQAFIDRLGDVILAILDSPESKALYEKLCKDLRILDKKKIWLDNIKDWISTYEFLVATWKNRHAFDNSLAPEEWESLKSMIRMLSPLHYYVELLRMSNSISASAAIRSLGTLLSMMDSYIKELDKLSSGASNLVWSEVLLDRLKGMFTMMKEKLIVFDNSLKSSPTFAIAIVLDPEMKLSGCPSIPRGLVYKKIIRLLKKVVKQKTSSRHDKPAQQTEMDLFSSTVLEGDKDIDATLEDSLPKAKKPKISVQEELDEYLQEACVVD